MIERYQVFHNFKTILSRYNALGHSLANVPSHSLSNIVLHVEVQCFSPYITYEKIITLGERLHLDSLYILPRRPYIYYIQYPRESVTDNTRRREQMTSMYGQTMAKN